MYTDEQYWNREELFEAVWSTPMRKLAQRYGISDVGLAKVCRKLSIPLPGLGYWAKIAAGHQVRKATLTPVMEEVRLRKPDLRPDLPKPAKSFSEQDRAQVGRIERCEWQVFLKRGSLSHPLIVQARETLRHEHADERQILWTSNPCLDIRVSKDSLDRAMRIMAAIICGLEAEGFSVAVGARQREQTTARIHGQELKFGLIEKVNRVELASPPKGGVWRLALN
jgi:hypothetical protein